jgi:hypothetical protein
MRMPVKLGLFAAALAALATIAGCDGNPAQTSTGGTGGTGTGGAGAAAGSGGMAGSGGDAGAKPEGNSVFVEVYDKAGAALPSVAMTRAGELKATNGSGQILYEMLSPGRFVARAEAEGYAPASVVLDLPDGVNGGALVHLAPLGKPIEFDSGADAKIKQGSSVELLIPSGSVIHEDGSAVVGNVTATITPLTLPAELDSLPGPFEGAALNGNPVNLESLTVAEISIWQGADRLQLKYDAKVMVEMLVPDALATKVKAGDVVGGFYFDLDKGLRREETTGEIKSSDLASGKLAWFGALPT